MANCIALAATTGLAAGIVFIVIMAAGMHDMQQRHFNISNGNPPRTEFHITDSGWVLLETSRLDISKEYYDYNQKVIKIMLKNSTLVELLSGEYIIVVGMGPSNCSFGSCAVARLSDMHDRTRDIQLIIDYDNEKVLSIRTQNW